ncbi:MAG: hypothetical protein M0036_20795 [Desulfobacteraceae bacterium]|nr:hypothetical protein [Desulfobacteraceae bacterium]
MREITIHIKDSTYDHLKAKSSTTPEGRAAAMLELIVDDMLSAETAQSEETH